MKVRFTSSYHFVVGCVFTAVVSLAASTGSAQSAVLSEIYGRGVHAYNAGQYDKASESFSLAIENGFQDPRAYYFRGLAIAASGRSDEAQGDFEQGAEIEARGAFGDSVGRSLARVQGSTRLQLELIRENARLRALALKQSRSQARYGELGTPAPANGGAPRPAAAGVRPPATRPRVVTPPATSAAADPFADDLDQDPTVESSDVLQGAMDNAAIGDAAAPADAGNAPASASPFDEPTGNDPFAAPANGDDPFGGAMDGNPFG